MKRLICIFFLLLFLAGCQGQKDNVQVPANFYYVQSEITLDGATNAVLSEVRECCDCGGDLKSMVGLYLSGPLSPELRSPFPAGTQVLEISQEESTIYLKLNAAYAELKGYNLTSANYCLAKTLLEYTGASTLQIDAENEELIITYSAQFHLEDFLISDTTIAN